MAEDADVIRIGCVGPFRPQRALVVPLEVSREKLRAELRQWEENRDLYMQRGWIILGVDDLWLELAILQPAANTAWPPFVAVTVGLDYRNYDLQPPSVTFLDPLSRAPSDPIVKPHQVEGQRLRLLVPGGHPTTKRPFLCLPGVSEYHIHPEHDGDPWLAEHRALGEGKIANIANHLWCSTRINLETKIQVQTQLAPNQAAYAAEAQGQAAEGACEASADEQSENQQMPEGAAGKVNVSQEEQ